MGKQGWQKQWGQPQSYSHYAGSYSQQAWGQNQWKSQGQNGSQGQHGAMKNLAEVPYSQVKVKEEDAAKPAAVAGDGELQKSLAQLAQRAVNQARRAAAKSKKAQEDLNNCQKAWAEYQRQMKDAFLRQHEQFQQDQEYDEAEIVKAKDAEKAAEDRLKEVLADNQVEPMMEEELREAAVEDDPWENLFKEPASGTGSAHRCQTGSVSSDVYESCAVYSTGEHRQDDDDYGAEPRADQYACWTWLCRGRSACRHCTTCVCCRPSCCFACSWGRRPTTTSCTQRHSHANYTSQERSYSSQQNSCQGDGTRCGQAPAMARKGSFDGSKKGQAAGSDNQCSRWKGAHRLGKGRVQRRGPDALSFVERGGLGLTGATYEAKRGHFGLQALCTVSRFYTQEDVTCSTLLQNFTACRRHCMLGLCGGYCMDGDESFTACRSQFPEKEMLNLCKHSDQTVDTSDSSLSAFAGVPGHQQGTFEHGRECTAFPGCFVVAFHEHQANFFTACRRHSGVEARLDVQGPAEIVLDPYLQILMGADASLWSSTTAQLASKLWHCNIIATAFPSWAQQPFWHMRKVSRTCSGIDSMLPSIAEGSLSLKHVKANRQSLGNTRKVYEACHFLENLAVSIATFIRTAALCSMLALWRLLFYAIPKKGGRYNADPLVSAGRGATPWVPLSLLWVVWIPGVQCSNPDFWNELSIIDRDIQIAESITRRTEVQHASDPPPPPLLTRSTVEPDHDLDRPWFEDAELQQEELQAWPEEPWLATAVVYNFQATPECISCWVQGDWGENDALQAMSEYLLEDEEDRMLYPLRPQPCDDCVHLFTTAAWIVGQFTPIVIDCTQCGGGRFLAHVGNQVRLDDIQGIMGPDWPRGAQVWQLSERAAPRRLGEDDMVATTMGGVFTITPRNELPTEWEPLGTRMRHPWTWARDVHTHGLPTFDRGIKNVQLLGTNT